MIDVAVVGAGSAGVATAVAAARAGASTVLLERADVPGGMSALALVHTICGLYELRDELRFANDGFAAAFASRLIRSGGAQAPVRMGKVWVLPHDPSSFAIVCADYLKETPGLEARFGAELVAVHSDGERVLAVEIRQGDDLCVVKARSFIDATGDASVVAMSGAGFDQSESSRLQRPAFIARLTGLAPGSLGDPERLRLAHEVATGVKSGDLSSDALGAAFRPGVREGDAFLTVDLSAGGAAWEPTSPDAIAEVETVGRRTVEQVLKLLRKRLPHWSAVTVAQWPARPGVRESRRARGVARLTGRDVLAGTQFDDGIAAVSWPMELRERATGPRWSFPTSDRPAQIPLRALRDGTLRNLWVVGRCISCDHEAQASIRVMGTCFATGEAAGLAAAMGTAGEQDPDWPTLAQDIIHRRRHAEYR
jgi:FAD dependent oxidoreductase